MRLRLRRSDLDIMVNSATSQEESVAIIKETIRAGAAVPSIFPGALDGVSEATFKRLVVEAVAEQITQITAVAVTRAVAILERRSKAIHDTTPVSALALPTRIANGLHRMGIKTVAELTALQADDILASPNLGERSLGQLQHVLGLMGRSLGESRAF